MRWTLSATITIFFMATGLLSAQPLPETPSSRAYKLLLEGDGLIEKGNIDAAIKRYEEAKTLRPYYAEASTRLARAHAAKRRLKAPFSEDGVSYSDETLRYSEAALNEQPTNIDALHIQASSEFIKPGKSASFDAYRDQIRVANQWMLGLELHDYSGFQMAKSHFVPVIGHGGESEAIPGYDRYLLPPHRATLLEPDFGLAFLFRGEALLRGGKKQAAQRDFLEFIRFDPLSHDVYKSLDLTGQQGAKVEFHKRRGLEFFARRAFSRASDEFAQMSKIAPTNALADYSHALLFVAGVGVDKTQEVAARRTLVGHVGAVGPDLWPRPVLECYLGRKSLDQMLKVEPSDNAGEGHFFMGLLRFSEGKYDQVITHFKAAEVQNLDSKRYEFNLLDRLARKTEPPQ